MSAVPPLRNRDLAPRQAAIHLWRELRNWAGPTLPKGSIRISGPLQTGQFGVTLGHLFQTIRLSWMVSKATWGFIHEAALHTFPECLWYKRGPEDKMWSKPSQVLHPREHGRHEDKHLQCDQDTLAGRNQMR